MTEDMNPKPAADQPKRKRRFLTGLLTGTVLGGLLAGGISAYSHHGPGGCWQGGHFGHRGGHDPQAMAERMDFAVEWVLQKVDASAQQRQQVKAIAKSALTDLMPLREEHRASRQAALDALAQAAIDRQALENIRRTELQRAETASTRIVQAMADIAEVLTPQQRTELAKYAARFQH